MCQASREEVKDLVLNGHYLGRMPAIPIHKFVWKVVGGNAGKKGRVKAVLLFGMGPGTFWPKGSLELQRLVRVEGFKEPLSQFISWAIRWLRANTDCSFVYSYADSTAGHHGGIYQASGFHFVRTRPPFINFWKKPDGSVIHNRTLSTVLGKNPRSKARGLGWEPLKCQEKYVYLRPVKQRLNPILRSFKWSSLPYIKPDHAACPKDEPGTHRT